METRKEPWGWSLWKTDPKTKTPYQVGARVGPVAPEFNLKHFEGV